MFLEKAGQAISSHPDRSKTQGDRGKIMVSGLGCAFEKGLRGLIVIAVYPGGPVFLQNDSPAGSKVNAKVSAGGLEVVNTAGFLSL